MYPDAAFQARVDAAIVQLENDRGGAVCPIRSIPLDLVAGEVARDLGVEATRFAVLPLVPDSLLVQVVGALVARYLGGPDARPATTSTLTFSGSATGPIL